MNEIIRIFKSIKNSGLLIDGASETVKDENKNKNKKTRTWSSCCFDDIYGYFIDSSYGFFIEETCGFFIGK